MFHPDGHPIERGWVGRIDGDSVVQLAAQTLQSFFSAAAGRASTPNTRSPRSRCSPPSSTRRRCGSSTRSKLRVREPGSNRWPGGDDRHPLRCAVGLPRLATRGGRRRRWPGRFHPAWRRARGCSPAPKDRDFALLLGPLVVTPDEHRPAGLQWEAALALAAANTRLRPGDILAGPVLRLDANLEAGAEVAYEDDAIGRLEATLGGTP